MAKLSKTDLQTYRSYLLRQIRKYNKENKPKSVKYYYYYYKQADGKLTLKEILKWKAFIYV